MSFCGTSDEELSVYGLYAAYNIAMLLLESASSSCFTLGGPIVLFAGKN